MKHRGLWLSLLTAMLGACVSEYGGTAVGNPGSMRVVASAAPEVQVSQGAWSVDLLFLDCAGQALGPATRVALDLTGQQEVARPGGSLCALNLAPRGPLVLAGTVDDERPFDLELLPPALSVSSQTPLTEEALGLALGPEDWLNAAELSGGVAPGSPDTGQLVRALLEGSQLFVDDDQDGLPDPNERLPGTSGPGLDNDDDDDDDDDDRDDDD